MTNDEHAQSSVQGLQQALEKANAKLNEYSAQLIQAGKQNILTELVTSVAHELNQPLNVTKIICQGLLRDIEKGRFSQEEAKNDLSEIVRQMDKLSDIIAQMCVFARRGRGLVLEAHDITTLVRNALKFITQQYKDRHIELILSLAAGLPPVMGDAVGIEQVCLNLLNNARDAVEKSQKLESKIEIKTYLSSDGNAVVLEVVDNGTGIPDDLKTKLFKPQFMTQGSQGGAGLGLSVCHKIIEEHHGQIEIESRVGQGTVFRVTLPANA